jgi:hypothetical protein
MLVPHKANRPDTEGRRRSKQRKNLKSPGEAAPGRPACFQVSNQVVPFVDRNLAADDGRPAAVAGRRCLEW